jgi:hypothetical protein
MDLVRAMLSVRLLSLNLPPRALGPGIEEGSTERSGDGIGFSVVGKFCEQELITKAIGMILASEKNEEAPRLRIGMDDDTVSEAQVRYNGAVKFRAIAIGIRVDGTENFDVQNGSLRENVKRIYICVTKTSL